MSQSPFDRVRFPAVEHEFFVMFLTDVKRWRVTESKLNPNYFRIARPDNYPQFLEIHSVVTNLVAKQHLRLLGIEFKEYWDFLVGTGKVKQSLADLVMRKER